MEGKRLIDKEKVIKGFDICLETIDEPDCPNGCPYFSDCSKYENRVKFQPLMRDALELLKEQETIVRCKDCKYNSGKCNGLYLQFVVCYKTGSPHKEDWYCADGERDEVG